MHPEVSMNNDAEQLAKFLIEVTAEATRVFESEEKAVEWLRQPCPALGGIKPIELLKTAEGAQLVLDIIGRIEHGVYS